MKKMKCKDCGYIGFVGEFEEVNEYDITGAPKDIYYQCPNCSNIDSEHNPEGRFIFYP